MMTKDLAAALALIDGRDPFRLEERARRSFDTVGALWDALRSLDLQEGWMELPSEVIRVSSALEVREGTPVLAGELVVGSRRSVHLRHVGTRFHWYELERVEDPDGVGTERTFYGANGPHPAPFMLRYEVEWMLTHDALGLARLQPARTRFAGFEDEGKS
jgi:hypothetical protein